MLKRVLIILFSAVCPERIETIICFNACFVNDEGRPPVINHLLLILLQTTAKIG